MIYEFSFYLKTNISRLQNNIHYSSHGKRHTSSSSSVTDSHISIILQQVNNRIQKVGNGKALR